MPLTGTEAASSKAIYIYKSDPEFLKPKLSCSQAKIRNMGGFAIGCLLPSENAFSFPYQIHPFSEVTKTKRWILHGLRRIWGRWLRQRNVSSMTRGWCCSVVPRPVKSYKNHLKIHAFDSCVQFFSGIEGQHFRTSNSFGALPFSEWQLWNLLMLGYETDFTIRLMMTWWMTLIRSVEVEWCFALPGTSSLIGLKFTGLTDRTRTHPQQKSERSEVRLECKHCKTTPTSIRMTHI